LSLGYFQKIDDFEAEPRFAGQAVVRRPTGGGAIWHEADLTYALAIPATHPLARRHVELYALVHEAIARALRDFNAPANRRGATDRIDQKTIEGTQFGARPFLCFTDRDPSDIILFDHKIVGGAQRRRRGAVLQHGSLLLRSSSRVPELPGLADLMPLSPQPSQWSGVLIDRILSALGLFSSTDETPSELFDSADIDERVRLVYNNETWTRRR
jgi:lipoate-protein ligase A